MRTFLLILLALLGLLALLSGISKILLLPQEVEFFTRLGFSNSLLITFGGVQVLGALLLKLSKTRFAGALIIALTFVLSAILLWVSGDIPMTTISLVVAALLLFTAKKTQYAG